MTVEAAAHDALLSDGSTVEIRHARPEDADDVRRMHEDLSPDNAYFRFFSFSPLAPSGRRGGCAAPEDDDHAALLARLDGGWSASRAMSRPAGPASPRSRSPSPTRCTAAASPRCCLSTWCRSPGSALTAFAAETLPENLAMQRVFADAGLPVERHFADGVIELMLPLPGHDGGRA